MTLAAGATSAVVARDEQGRAVSGKGLAAVELFHAQAHLADDGTQGSDWDVARMPGHGNGDVLFGEVEDRVTAGPDSR